MEMNRIFCSSVRGRARIAAAATGVLAAAFLVVASAAAKPPPPPMNVPCAGQAALVAAINAANSAGGGTLNLAPHCHYALTTPDNGENGLPVVTTRITVNGRDATIDGTGSVRVFEVDGPGGNLSLHDLTVTRGSAQDFGGGILNNGGTVAVDDSHVNGNAAVVAGGGIANATFDPSSVATLTLHNSSVSGNQQTLDEADGGGGGGGIINVTGTLSLDHSQVNGNTAQGGVGGGIASGDYFGTGGDSVLTVDDSQVNGNVAPAAGGGGIQNLLGSATVDHSQVNGNTSLNGAGIASGNTGDPSRTAELRVSHSQVNGNTATGGPGGEGPPVAAGGIANGSNAVVDHSQVDHNTATHGIGAGIVNHGSMAVNHSEVDHNAAPASGFAGSGGGILNAQGPPGTAPAVLTIDHSKVDDNSAGGYGGGIANGVPLPPGPPPLIGGDLTLRHSEVNHNSAAHGGGIFNNGGTVTLEHTKVTGNHVDNCEPAGSIPGCNG
jgi:hypothetical protein